MGRGGRVPGGQGGRRESGARRSGAPGSGRWTCRRLSATQCGRRFSPRRHASLRAGVARRSLFVSRPRAPRSGTERGRGATPEVGRLRDANPAHSRGHSCRTHSCIAGRGRSQSVPGVLGFTVLNVAESARAHPTSRSSSARVQRVVFRTHPDREPRADRKGAPIAWGGTPENPLTVATRWLPPPCVRRNRDRRARGRARRNRSTPSLDPIRSG